MNPIRAHGTTIFFLSLVAATLVATSLISPQAPIIPREMTFSDAQKNAITVLVEMNKLIVSLALLVIGGVSAVIFKLRDTVGPLGRGDRLLLVLALVGSALSLYFGFVLYFRMVEMLGEGGFVANASLLRTVQKEQYYTFATAVVMLALVVVRRLDYKPGGEHGNASDSGPSHCSGGGVL